MRFRDRPLLVDGLDARLYLGRPELERRVVEALLSDRNVLLLGDAGSGKSTLLRKAASVLRTRGRDAVLVNAALARDATQLLELVDDAMPDGSARAPQRPGSSGLLNAARRLQRPSPVAILLDGLSDAEIGYDLFGRLRDELWELGHPWGVAVRPRDSGALRSPPADAFWSDIVEIPPLDAVQTERLLRLGLDEEEYQTVLRGRTIAGTHPRSVIREVQQLLAGDRDSLASPGTELLDRASAVGRSEAMAMAELQGLGRPVSAHDPELLTRLGWSRSYAQRILSRLEANGLLRTMPERGEGIGRPRKLYEPRPRRELQ
jgi:hypothetical protein